MDLAAAWRAEIAPIDPAVASAARTRIDALTKPPGSLGRIEALAVRLSGIAGAVPPPSAYDRRVILIGAGDHGVTEAGVSAYPREVTAQMVHGFLAGTAAISAFARAVNAQVFVADFGVDATLPSHPNLLDVKCGHGTADLSRRPAIVRDDLGYVLAAGVAAFDEARAARPFDVLALGEMGIGNTTAAAAITAAMTGGAPAHVVGRGTGIDDARLAHKIDVVERALARCVDRTWDEVASEVGGYEIVGLAGTMLAAARARIPVVLDGAIVAAAALIAVAIAPAAQSYLIAAHRSIEPGHALALRSLALEPLFDLGLRLGEASGAALALPLVSAAARMTREMKTFEEAGVSNAGVTEPA